MNPKLFNRVFVGLTLLLTIFYAYWLGVDVSNGDTKEAIADGILLAFWLFAFVFFSAMTLWERKMERELNESRRDLDKALDDFLGTLKKDADESMARKKQFVATFNEVTGKDFFEAKTVSARHKKEIEKRFHEKTGVHADISVKPGGVIGVELSKEAPARKKAPVKKPVAKKKVTTKKEK